MPKTRSPTKQKNAPVDSSTPHLEYCGSRISSRRSIHEPRENSVEMFSPILVPQKRTEQNNHTSSENDRSSESDSDEPSPLAEDEVNTTENIVLSRPLVSDNFISNFRLSITKHIVLSMLIVGALCAFAYNMGGNESDMKTIPTLKDLQNRFPSQTKDLWYAFKSGINEVIQFTKPSVFLLLYEDHSQNTVNHFVRKISQYSVCKLKGNCTVAPLELSNNILNSKEVVSDYGHLIDKYKHELEHKGVMVVNNIEQIKGKVAQVFHTMCDEYTPLVDKAIFIFTMKVAKFPEGQKDDMKLVESILELNWNDLEPDLFYPLFTRITSIVLRILPEKFL